jgi:uncharacterized membrane protein YdjX (TVP38/TMEM64 family)
MRKVPHPAWPRRLAAGLGLAGTAALVLWASLGRPGFEPGWLELSPAQVEDFVASWGMWGVAASMALMVLHSFVPIPAEVIAIANGMMFGPWWGTLVTWSGAMLGAISAFALARWLGRPVVRRFVAEERRAGIEAWTRRPFSLLLLRLIPVVSFNLVNFAAGLAGTGWRTFLWTTALGILPLTVVSVVLGARIFEIAWWVWAAIGVAVAIFGLAAHNVLLRMGKAGKSDAGKSPHGGARVNRPSG